MKRVVLRLFKAGMARINRWYERVQYLDHWGLAGWRTSGALIRARYRDGLIEVGGGRLPVQWVRGGTSDVPTFTAVWLRQEYGVDHLPHHAWLDRAIEAARAAGKSPVILDLGANVGYSAVWFAKHFPAAEIVAVEPDGGNLQLLRKNVAAWPKVRVVEGAVWAESGEVALADPGMGAWGFRVDAAGSGVRAWTVRELLQLVPGASRLCIAKLDIEGGEQPLLADDVSWLSDTDCVMIELHDWMLPGDGTARTVMDALQRTGPWEYAIRGENLFAFRAPPLATAERPAVSSAQVAADHDRSASPMGVTSTRLS
jgi:FkbM family methyltransferase